MLITLILPYPKIRFSIAVMHNLPNQIFHLKLDIANFLPKKIYPSIPHSYEQNKYGKVKSSRQYIQYNKN